ncbi:hypothetical protein [Rhizobium sp. BK251]|uniref:hypothetical protein n=1 Tax=Rhizobium sp. BK251 TaxID=2512125 RepID=UPI00104D2DF7|nr:hypothetical protein [Rhizobium sp. BK251]
MRTNKVWIGLSIALSAVGALGAWGIVASHRASAERHSPELQRLIGEIDSGHDVSLNNPAFAEFDIVCLASDLPSQMESYNFCEQSGTYIAFINEEQRHCLVSDLDDFGYRVLSGSTEYQCVAVGENTSLSVIRRYGQSHLVFKDM